MLSSQKHKFSLPDTVTYLNCAYMSPLLKSVEAAGIESLQRKSQPFMISPDDFFSELKILKGLYAQLLHVKEPQRIAICPSTSYGIATIAKNIPLQKGDNIVLLEEQFPSNVYTWQRLADEKGIELRFVSAPTTPENRAKRWNEKILENIDTKTAVVTLPHVHWADGTRFDLKAIRQKSTEVKALLIIDGTQSIGAMPFSVEEIKPDAVVCAAYKWLLGGYSFSLAYYGRVFDEGIPIEESWMNRLNSEDFKGLVNYQSNYKPYAGRYEVGEASNFVNTAMSITAISQLLEWTPQGIQDYCEALTKEPIKQLQSLGCVIENAEDRGHHLFGIRLAKGMDLEKLRVKFAAKNIHVSLRGNAVRIAPHLYNEASDFERFLECF